MARDARLVGVALAGGIGTASGAAYVQFVRDLGHWSALEIVSFFAGSAVVAWLAWRFVEPFLATVFLTHRLPESPRHAPQRMSFRRYAKVFLVVLTTAVFAEALVHSLTHGIERVVLWLTATVAYGLVTYSWGVGAQRTPPRPARMGTLAGLAVGGVTSGAVALIAWTREVPGVLPTVHPNLASFLGYAAGGAISMGLRGLVGGKAVELAGRMPAGLRVALSIGVLSLLQGIPAALTGDGDWWSRAAEGLGWGAGLLFHSATDAVLRPSDRSHQATPVEAVAPEPVTGPLSSRAPRAPARRQPVPPDALRRRERIAVALGGGIGAASALAYALFLDDIRTWHATQIISFFVVTAIVTWLAWRFMEPFFASVLLERRLPRLSGMQERRRHFGKAFLAVLTSAVTLEVLLHSFTTRGGQGFLFWLASVVIFSSITFGWTRGVLRRPPRAGRVGAMVGGLVGAATLGGLGLFVGGAVVFPAAQGLAGSTTANPTDAVSLAFSGLVTMAARGYGGGKAVDLGGRLPVGVRVTLGVVVIVIAQIALELGGMRAMGLAYVPPWGRWLLEAVGWGLGVLLCPYSEAVLGRRDGEPATQRA